jgi:GrpB-like predicted nucleotidyltransferase (UPF0157 family)
MIVEIVPYKESWRSEFLEIAAMLRQALGDLALRVDHMGSTSVPELPAKDVIDIQITVAALDLRVISAMTSLGYALLFRDYLRSHPATAEAYAELKRRLAENLADPQAYPEVKDPAVDLIYLAAEDWAAITHWQPAPPDA